ncbi:phosphate transport system regulatory protein PhoU [Streptococcus pneumoniae]|nr:phosphate transport system regulatory protein PhoU [Streptococcus pneumoniae]
MKGEERIPAVEEEIKKMGREVKSVVEAALDLYLNGSVDDAYRVASMDEQINHYFETIRDLATEEIKKNPEAIVTGRDYFQVISYLERIGDYAKNICEWVVYFETGKIVEL